MKFDVSVAALFAVSAQLVGALSTLSTRNGVTTATVTATSFETATSTITSLADITSTVTTCAVGTATPIDQAIPLPFLLASASACTNTIFGSESVFWNRKCSGSSLSGGTTIRAYANNQGIDSPLSFAVMACSMLPTYGTPCAGINVQSNGYMTQYFLVNGDVTIESAAASLGVVEKYTTNPCETVATVTTTSYYPVVETVAVTYTTTYEIGYLQTISLSLPDPTASSSSTMSNSSFSAHSNTTTSATTATLPPVFANATSTQVVLPIANNTVNATLPSLISFPNSTTSNVIPTTVNASSTIIPSSPSSFSSSNSSITVAPLYDHTSATAVPSVKHLSTLISSSSIPADSTSASLTFILNTTSAAFPASTLSSSISLNTTLSSNISATALSYALFHNTTSSTHDSITSPISSAPVVIADQALPASPSTHDVSSSAPSSPSSAPITLTTYAVTVFTVTTCPSTVQDCAPSLKTISLITKTIAGYTTIHTTATVPTSPISASKSRVESISDSEEQKLKYTTLTVYSTSVQAMTACPSTVKNCPASEKTVYYTDVVLAHTRVSPVSATTTGVSAMVAFDSSFTSKSNRLSRKISYTTSTLYSTSTQMITACTSNVEHCPASEKTVYYTDIVKTYTTICPVSTSATDAAPITSAFAQPSAGTTPSFGSESSSEHPKTLPFRSGFESTSAVPQATSMPGSKVVMGSDSATVLPLSAASTYTADGKIQTSAVILPVTSVVSSLVTVTSKEIVAVSTGRTQTQKSSSSVAWVPYVTVPAASSHGFDTAGAVRMNATYSTVSLAQSNASFTVGSSSPSLVSYKGSASLKLPSMLSAVVCALLAYGMAIL